MGHYQMLMRLNIKHSYFADGFCHNLTIVPTQHCARLLREYEIILKQTGSGFYLVGDIAKNVATVTAPLLRFEVFAQDVYFNSYTEANTGANTEVQLRYYATAQAAADGTIANDSSMLMAETVDVAPPRRKVNDFIKPIMIVDVQLNPQNFIEAAACRDYSVQLYARKYHWKYYFFGELAKLELHIEDLRTQEPIGFDALNEATANDGKTLISKIPLPLSENSDLRFQLKDKQSFGKVLIKRLPNAGVQMIGKGRNSSGHSVFVAEIYINQ